MLVWEMVTLHAQSRFHLDTNFGVNSMLTCQDRSRNRESCEVVFQRGGHDIETLYWAGSSEETCELARNIAYKCGADTFRIVDFTDSRTGLILGEAVG